MVCERFFYRLLFAKTVAIYLRFLIFDSSDFFIFFCCASYFLLSLATLCKMYVRGFYFSFVFQAFFLCFFLLLLLLHSAWHFDFYLNKHGASFCEARFNKAKIKNENKFVGSVNLYRYAEGAATISPHRMKFILLLLFYVLHVDVPTNSICIPIFGVKKKQKSIRIDGKFTIRFAIVFACVISFQTIISHTSTFESLKQKREKKNNIFQ